MLNAKFFQHRCEGRGHVDAGVRASDLNDVEEKHDWLAIMLEVNGYGDKGAMVEQSPCVGGKAQAALVFLQVIQVCDQRPHEDAQTDLTLSIFAM